jgi:ribonuclease P protein component
MAGRPEQGFHFGTLRRLHRPAEFAAVMSSRGRIYGGCFELRYRLHPCADGCSSVGSARLGLIIPKRLAKHAVLRNLLKRLARESFRNACGSLPPADVVLRLAKPPLPADQVAGPEQRSSWRRSIDELLAGLAAK